MQFRILGALEVTDGDSTLPLAGAKQRALLALLLLNANEVVPSDRLVDELWGDHPPAKAISALHVQVSGLRKLLGASGNTRGDDEILVTRPPGYMLRVEESELDLARFVAELGAGREALAREDAADAAERLRAALSLWRGAPLADLVFEPWAQTEIARLEELRLSAVEERIEADLALGRHHALVAELEALATEHPLRERPRRQLMLALYRGGRHAEALERYREARRLLVGELGIEPSRELQALEHRILVQDPTLDLPQTPVADAEIAGADDGRDARVFVGRDAELAQLRVALDDAVQGRGSLVLISGDPGIGKSSLAEELARAATRTGARVLVGRCWEAGGAPAYWPWVQAIRSYLRACEAAGVPVDTATVGPELAQVMPELGADIEPGVGRATDLEASRFRLFESVAAFLRAAAAEQPLVVVLDDLHAADASSVLLLRFIAGELERVPMLVIAIYRDIELGPEHPVASTVGELSREAGTRTMPVKGLELAGISQLLEATIGVAPPDAMVTSVARETEGNPLFIGELVRALASEGRLDGLDRSPAWRLAIPRGIREIIDRRLRNLSTPCRELLALAAVLGREFGLDALERVSDLPVDDVLEALDEAIAAHIVDEAPTRLGRFRFSHGLIREALYDELTAVTRMRLHARAGEALEQLYAADTGPHLAELAHHFFSALPTGDPDKALEYASRAGDRAMDLLAFEEAARLYDMAVEAHGLRTVDEAARCQLLLRAGEAKTSGGDAPGSKRSFLEAARIAKELGLAEELARAALGYGGRLVWGRAGRDGRLVPLLEDALLALGPGDSALRVRVLARLAGALRDQLDRERGAALSREAVEVARRLAEPNTIAYALSGQWAASWWPENPAERLAVAGELGRIADEIGDSERAAQARAYRVITLVELGQSAGTNVDAQSQLRIAHELRQPIHMWLSHLIRAMLALFQGRFEVVDELLAASLRAGARAFGEEAHHSYLQQEFVLRREQGRLQEIMPRIEEAVARFNWYPVWHCILTSAYAELGREAEARAELSALAADDFSALPRDNNWLFGLGLLSDVCAAVGDLDAAAQLYDLQLPHAECCANTAEVCTGCVSRPLGVLAAMLSRFDEAEEHFARALAVNSRMGARPWVAHTQLAYGQMLSRKGDRGGAAKAFDAARAGYDELGMDAWTRKARALATG